MVHRHSILISAACIALIVYALIAAGLIRRALIVCCPMPGDDWRAAPGVIRNMELTSPIEILGIKFPFKVVAAAVLTVPAMLVANDIAIRRRRYQRERDNACITCGHPLRTWRGRCPGCGVRIGPG